MTETDYVLRPLRRHDAEAIVRWRYEPPYDFYNLDAGAIQSLLRPDYHYYAVLLSHEELIGFRCYGVDARVRGGDYTLPALDMGGGLRPDLTGRGLGSAVIQAAMQFALARFYPERFRAVVASFNGRAIRTCIKVGYECWSEFEREIDQRRFTVLVKDAKG